MLGFRAMMSIPANAPREIRKSGVVRCSWIIGLILPSQTNTSKSTFTYKSITKSHNMSGTSNVGSSQIYEAGDQVRSH